MPYRVLEAAQHKWHQWAPLPSAFCFGSVIRGHWQELEKSEMFIASTPNLSCCSKQWLCSTQVQGFYWAVLSYSSLGSFKLSLSSLFTPRGGKGSLLLLAAWYVTCPYLCYLTLLTSLNSISIWFSITMNDFIICSLPGSWLTICTKILIKKKKKKIELLLL